MIRTKIFYGCCHDTFPGLIATTSRRTFTHFFGEIATKAYEAQTNMSFEEHAFYVATFPEIMFLRPNLSEARYVGSFSKKDHLLKRCKSEYLSFSKEQCAQFPLLSHMAEKKMNFGFHMFNRRKKVGLDEKSYGLVLHDLMLAHVEGGQTWMDYHEAFTRYFEEKTVLKPYVMDILEILDRHAEWGTQVPLVLENRIKCMLSIKNEAYEETAKLDKEYRLLYSSVNT
ncbi:MAG: hypothetical protein ACMXYK_01825 [Candidatus Woesearchaeota archaeon]